MNQGRFEHLLDAYGANFERWPEKERAAGEAYAQAHAESVSKVIAEARLLDEAFESGRVLPKANAALVARIMSAAPRARPMLPMMSARAGWALAACALVGAVLGYGVGALTPPADDGSYFAAAFEAPPPAPPSGDEG